MQFIIDHILSIVIGLVVMLIMFFMVQQGQRTSIEAVQQRALKRGMADLIEVVELDFQNIGAGMVNRDEAIDTLTPNMFRFYSRTDIGVTDSQLVRYTWEVIDTLSLFDDGAYTPVEVVQISRFVEGQLRGKSPPSLAAFEINLQDNDGNVAANYADVKALEVRIAALSTLGTTRTVGQSEWTTTFRPLNLNLNE